MLDKKLLKKLKNGFEYLKQYDELGDYPDKKVPVSVSLPVHLKKRLSQFENISEYIEQLIEQDMQRKKKIS